MVLTFKEEINKQIHLAIKFFFFNFPLNILIVVSQIKNLKVHQILQMKSDKINICI